MHHRHQVTYEASAAEVFAMLADPAFRRAVAAAQHVRRCEVSVTPDGSGEGMHVVLDQDQPTAGVPASARRFVGETTHAVVREDWTSGRAATFAVETSGAPVAISGTITLVESGGTTTQTHEADLVASVPVVGGRLEKVAAGLLAEARDTEQAVGAAWLKGEK